tara:strand:- start:1896 stop:2120 length:225 start_codon:yes stop_codon:yes gene_type:complete
MAFTFTQEKYEKLLSRITALENHHNNIAIAMDQFVSLSQIQELLVLVQTKLDDFESRLSSLENRITAIEEEPLD